MLPSMPAFNSSSGILSSKRVYHSGHNDLGAGCDWVTSIKPFMPSPLLMYSTSCQAASVAWLVLLIILASGHKGSALVSCQGNAAAPHLKSAKSFMPQKPQPPVISMTTLPVLNGSPRAEI